MLLAAAAEHTACDTSVDAEGGVVVVLQLQILCRC